MVPKVIDMDPHTSIATSKGSIHGHVVEWSN